MYKAHYFFIILGLVLMIYIIMAVRKKKMSVDYTLLWSLGAVGIFIIGCFPDIIVWTADLVGISYPPSLLFLLSIAFLLILSLNNSIIITELKEKNKDLIQQTSLLEKRVRELEDKEK